MDSTDTFSQNVKALAAKQHAEDPVETAKRDLAAVRESALAAIAEFQREAARWAPVFAIARSKWQRASAIGKSYAPLGHKLNEAEQLLAGGRAGFQAVVERIDNLDEWSVFQGTHRLPPGELNNRRANIGALATIAHEIEYHVSVLEQWLAEA